MSIKYVRWSIVAWNSCSAARRWVPSKDLPSPDSSTMNVWHLPEFVAAVTSVPFALTEIERTAQVLSGVCGPQSDFTCKTYQNAHHRLAALIGNQIPHPHIAILISRYQFSLRFMVGERCRAYSRRSHLVGMQHHMIDSALNFVVALAAVCPAISMRSLHVNAVD